MRAEVILEKVKKILNDLDTVNSKDLLGQINTWEHEFDNAEKEALNDLEEELLSNSGRFCINGNCEE